MNITNISLKSESGPCKLRLNKKTLTLTEKPFFIRNGMIYYCYYCCFTQGNWFIFKKLTCFLYGREFLVLVLTMNSQGISN